MSVSLNKSCKWETEPTIKEFIHDLVDFFKEAGKLKDPVVVEWRQQIYAEDMYCFIAATMAFTIAGLICKNIVFKDLVKNLDIPEAKKVQIRENLWYTLSLMVLLFISIKYAVISEPFFQCPSTMWDDWSLTERIGDKYFLTVALGSGYYLNNMISVVFLEARRKDTASAMFHHAVTTVLFFFTYCLRYHHVSVLATVVLNVTSIPLFALQILSQLKGLKDARVKYVFHGLNVSLGLFFVSWIVFRLYWYPLKVLYAVGPVVVKKKLLPKLPYISIYVFLLSLYLVLNVFWFIMLLKMMYKVAVSGMKGAKNDCSSMDKKET